MLLPSALGRRGSSMLPTLWVFGKRPGQSSLMAAAVDPYDSLLYVWDSLSGRHFLVDTGAKISILSPAGLDIHNGKLRAAISSSIRTLGTCTIPLSFGNCHFTWTFTFVVVVQPILGANFLQDHCLLVDLKGWHLVHAKTSQNLPLGEAKLPDLNLDSITLLDNEFSRILAVFPSIVMPQFSAAEPKCGVKHHILTEGPPHFTPWHVDSLPKSSAW
ncbi:uncharacterized protein [Narcine bancroftii]|uniref:uncharacterized protein n=1 Tax=Narcine bancroftii TaxID=1343680 RepID=UPI0038319D63